MYKRGTIVLVPFPFSDLSGNKVRPAVIVSGGKIGEDVVVVFITTQMKQKGKYTIIITPTTKNGLRAPSQIICSKIATLDAKVILGELGEVDDSVQENMDQELRQVLSI